MTTLSDELTNDPEALGYQQPINAGDHQSVAALLNEPRYSTIGARPVGSAELLIWGGQQGRLQALEDAVADTGQSAALRSISDAALRMIQRSDTQLDLRNPDVSAMVQALVDAGVFAASDKTSLETLATQEISRSEQLGLGRVTHRDIREAL